MINFTSPGQYKLKDAAAMGLMTGSVVAAADAGINLYKMKGQPTEDKFVKDAFTIIDDTSKELFSIRTHEKINEETADALTKFYTRNAEKQIAQLDTGKAITANLNHLDYKGIAKKAGIVGGLAALGVILLMGLAKLSAAFTGRK